MERGGGGGGGGVDGVSHAVPPVHFAHLLIPRNLFMCRFLTIYFFCWFMYP